MPHRTEQNKDTAGYWPVHARARPSWWGAEKVLELLRNGESAPEICKRGSDEIGNKVRPDILRKDISTWAGTASMGDDFQAALALYKKQTTGELVLSLSSQEQGEFLAALEAADGVIEDACQQSCIGEHLVYAVLDRRNKKLYNEAFAEKVRVLEGRRMARIRKRVLESAETGDDPKVGLKVLESGMSTLHGPRQHVEVSGTVEHDHNVRLAREVVESSAAKVRGLMTGRENGHAPAALPEPRQAIDVTARVVEKVAAE